jgi:internalin A
MKCLCEMSNISELELNNNQISEIPESIYKMKSLVELNLSYNPMPHAYSLKSCFNLKDLSLNGCNIIDTSFFISLGKLTSLDL